MTHTPGERRKLKDVGTPDELRQYLTRLTVPPLQSHREMTKEQVIHQAMEIRKWVSTVASFSNEKLLLKHKYDDVIVFLHKLLRYEGGLWCAGVAKVYADILYQIYGIPAAVLVYGYSDSGLSHVTTLVGYREGKDVKFTVIDAYLGFHYESNDGEILALDEVLSCVVSGNADKVKRVDVELPRAYLSTEDTILESETWMFNAGAESTLHNWVRVYPGAVISIPKLYCGGSTMLNLVMDRIGVIRSAQDLDNYLLSLMLVNPELSRINISCKDCYADSRMAFSLFSGVAKGLQNEETARN